MPDRLSSACCTLSRAVEHDAYAARFARGTGSRANALLRLLRPRRATEAGGR